VASDIEWTIRPEFRPENDLGQTIWPKLVRSA
jgi:hypothetical protein